MPNNTIVSKGDQIGLGYDYRKHPSQWAYIDGKGVKHESVSSTLEKTITRAGVIDSNNMPITEFKPISSQAEFIIDRCPLYEHGFRTKNTAIMQFYVDLLEVNNNEELCCENVKKNLKKLAGKYPMNKGCYECPYWSWQQGKLKAQGTKRSIGLPHPEVTMPKTEPLPQKEPETIQKQ